MTNANLKTIRQWAGLCILCTILPGCAGLPVAERQANATTEVSEAWSRDQKERIKAVVGAVSDHPSGGMVDVSIDSRESGNGDQSLFGDLASTIPGGIKMIYAGIGIIVLVGALKFLANSSRSARALMSAADNAAAKQIRKLEGMLEATTNEKERMNLMTLLRDAESERGKLKT